MEDIRDNKENENQFNKSFRRVIYGLGVGSVLFAAGLIGNNMETASPFSYRFNTQTVYNYRDLERTLNQLEKHEEEIIGRKVFIRNPSEEVKPLFEDLFGKRRQKLEQLAAQLRVELNEMKQNPQIQIYNEWRNKKDKYSIGVLLGGSGIFGGSLIGGMLLVGFYSHKKIKRDPT